MLLTYLALCQLRNHLARQCCGETEVSLFGDIRTISRVNFYWMGKTQVEEDAILCDIYLCGDSPPRKVL